jgi:two-component system sensor histidine kinase UhpB
MPFRPKTAPRGQPPRIDADHTEAPDLPLEELGLTAVWVVFAGLWTVFTEAILDWLGGDPIDSPALAVMTGLNFTLTSGLLLYAVLRRSFGRRRKAVEASRVNHERFRAVALATTDAIWDWDLAAKSVWRSDGFMQLFGYGEEELAASIDGWRERLHPEDRDRVFQGIQDVIDAGGRVWSGEYRVRRKDGTYADVLDRTHVLRDPEGRPIRIVGGISDVSERRRAEAALAASREQLRALSARLRSLREEERTRLAREIHDELGQLLTVLKINLDWLERRIGEREGAPELNPWLERVVEAGELTDATLASVRKIATELRPAALDTLGLPEALQQEASRFRERTGIPCRIELPEEPPKLSPVASTAVFRIFQEALTNVARHAQATGIRARLSAANDRVLFDIEDDGKGVDPARTADTRSLGLLGMRERAAVLGGDLVVERASPAGGTRVTLRLPLDADEPETRGRPISP